MKNLTQTMARLTLLAAALSATGCKQKASDEQCDKIAAKMVELALAETPHGDTGKAAAQAMLEQLGQQCEQDRPTEDQVECLLSASSRAQVAKCS